MIIIIATAAIVNVKISKNFIILSFSIIISVLSNVVMGIGKWLLSLTWSKAVSALTLGQSGFNMTGLQDVSHVPHCHGGLQLGTLVSKLGPKLKSAGEIIM